MRDGARRRGSVLLAATLAAVALACQGSGSPAVATAPRPPVTTVVPAVPPVPMTPSATPVPTPNKLDSKRLAKDISRYLRGRPLSMTVRDLTTGQTFRYRPTARFVTASVAKVDIVMTLLLQAQKDERKLSSTERELASQAIRYSDNHATDRLWERIGGASAVASANRKFGLKDTRTVDGKCLDLYCWGITDTTTVEQVRLLDRLVDDGSPLTPENRDYLLGLMGKVVKEQAWGVSAAARKGDEVALKNGWQRRLAHGKLWAINSVGRVRADGHDLLIAVLSDHHSDTGAGIAVVERVVEMAAEEFRRTTPWLQ